MRDSTKVLFAAPNLHFGGIVGDIQHFKSVTVREKLETAARMQVQMTRRVQLDPVGTVLPPSKPEHWNPYQQDAVGVQLFRHGGEYLVRLCHVLERMMHHDQSESAVHFSDLSAPDF